MSDPIYDVRTFWELLEQRAAATGDRMMLVDEAGRSVTFAEFKDRAERVAAGLQAMGVGPRTPVTWVLPTRIETVLLSFALSRLGAVQNPIIHIYRHREVGFCIQQTQSRAGGASRSVGRVRLRGHGRRGPSPGSTTSRG